MLRATLDATSDGILVTDEQQRVTAYNEKFVEMWRVPMEVLHSGAHAAVARVISEQLASPPDFLAAVETIAGSGEPSSSEVVELTDGRMIERQSSPQMMGGRQIGRVWMYRDITRQWKAQEALRDETRVLELVNSTGRELATKRDLRSAVQAVTEAGTRMIGAQFGAFFYNAVNEAGEALLLYTLAGAPVEAFEKFGHPRATALFGPTFRGEPPIRSDDILLDPRYGRSAPHNGMPQGHLPVRSYLAVPVISRSGEVIGGLFFGHPQPGVFDERSERIMMGIAAQAAVAIDNARLHEAAIKAAAEREALLESERAARALAERMSSLKDDFLATLSHELRTPLSSIVGWIQILRRNADKPEDVRKGIEVIERNARAQGQLIEDLLDMNRIASGKVRLDIQPVQPISFIEAALESVMPAADAKNIRIVRILDPSAGPVPGDPGRLRQVMTNLLSNAVKFTPRGGKVQVLLERVNSHVEISVSDTGIGIKQEFLAHVFERFRQSDGSTTRRFGGLGLGLSIVKNLVELHGGTVRVASDGEGRGATFYVHLPVPLASAYGSHVDRTHPRTILEPVTQVDLPDLSGLTVLVVDDAPDARELATRMLEECGAMVVAAENAAEGLRIVEEKRPDVVISDIGMPDVDGYTFLRQVRQLGRERGGDVPAIALTAFARPQDRIQALRAGFVAHLAKPVDAPELLAVVAAAAHRLEVDPDL